MATPQIPYSPLVDTLRNIAQEWRKWLLQVADTAYSAAATWVVNGATVTVLSGVNRIQADFSSAVAGFQSSVTNGQTVVDAIPNGTSIQAGFRAWNSNAVTNSSFGHFVINNTGLYIESGKVGAGGYVPMIFYAGGNSRLLLNAAAGFQISSYATDWNVILKSANQAGTFYHMNLSEPGGVSYGTIYSVGGTTTYATTSDRRKKRNIEDAAPALASLSRYRVVQHDWNDFPDVHVDYSFVAQELADVAPIAVAKGGPGDALVDDGSGEFVPDGCVSWGVDPSKLVPYLFKVCQEQQLQIEALQASVNSLASKPSSA
jgi:hypothetical protein